MPSHQRFRLDNRNDRQDRWKPSIHLDEETAVVVGKLGSTPHLAPQDDQLMSEHRILRLKPALRLERRGQHGQNKPNQRDHRASLADSVTRKIRIRFSVHTRHRDGAASWSTATRPSSRSIEARSYVRACARYRKKQRTEL